MEYKIQNQIIINKPDYGALGDDFSFEEMEAVDIIVMKIERILNENAEIENIYGKMCYRIQIEKEISKIYCENDFLGEEFSIDIYNMFLDYRESLKLKYE